MAHAKGDIEVSSSTTVEGILTVGADGFTVVADSAQTLGVKWAAPLSASTVTSTPGRALDTTFTPSATRLVLVIYSVDIDCTSTLASGADGAIELRSDTSSPPTTVRSSHRNRMVQTLGITVGTNSVVRGVISYLVPATHNVRLVTVTTLGAPVFTLVHQTEITL